MLECKGMVSDMADKPSLKPNIEMECQARVFGKSCDGQTGDICRFRLLKLLPVYRSLCIQLITVVITPVTREPIIINRFIGLSLIHI